MGVPIREHQRPPVPDSPVRQLLHPIPEPAWNARWFNPARIRS